MEFDFSGSNRPKPHYDLPISSRKMLNILSEKLQLLKDSDQEWAREFLDDLEIGMYICIYFMIWICDMFVFTIYAYCS